MMDNLFLFYAEWKQIRKELSLINVMFLSGIREKLLSPPHSCAQRYTTFSPHFKPSKRALKTDRPPPMTQTAHDTVGQDSVLPAQRTEPKWPFTLQIWVLGERQTKRATSNTISCSSGPLCLWLVSGEQRAGVCTALERHAVCNPLISSFSFLISFSLLSFSCSNAVQNVIWRVSGHCLPQQALHSWVRTYCLHSRKINWAKVSSVQQ